MKNPNNKKHQILSRVSAKKISAKAAEKQRKKHLKNNLKSKSLSEQHFLDNIKSKATDDTKKRVPI